MPNRTELRLLKLGVDERKKLAAADELFKAVREAARRGEQPLCLRWWENPEWNTTLRAGMSPEAYAAHVRAEERARGGR